MQLWINSIAFPLGIAVGVWAAIKLMRLLRSEDRQRAEDASPRVLFFGLLISLITLSLWTISGIVFPIAVNVGMPLEGVVGFYSHFFVSLVLCGIVAMAYPYFMLTALAVRCYFPALVRNGVVSGPRWRDLQRVRFLNRVFLGLTAIVPMVALLLGISVGVEQSQKWALIVAGVGGIAGLAVMFTLERFIDKNLDALQKIAVDAPRES